MADFVLSAPGEWQESAAAPWVGSPDRPQEVRLIARGTRSRVTARLTESVVEEAALALLEGMGWQIAHGPDIAPDMPAAERTDCGEVVLARRLRDALARLTPSFQPTRWRTPSASLRARKARI